MVYALGLGCRWGTVLFDKARPRPVFRRPARPTMAYTVGRGLTAAERQDIKEAFDLCADVPEGSDRGCARALSRHGLSCAMMSLLGYKPATVRKCSRRRHRRRRRLCHGLAAVG